MAIPGVVERQAQCRRHKQTHERRSHLRRPAPDLLQSGCRSVGQPGVEGEHRRNERDPDRGGDHGQVRGDLPLHGVGEGPDAVAADLLEQAAEVGSVLGRTEEVEKAEGAHCGNPAGRQPHEPPPGHRPAAQPQHHQSERGHGGEDAADVGAPEGKAVGQEGDDEDGPGDPHTAPPRHHVGDDPGEEDGAGRHLTEGQVAEPGEASADGGGVAEDGAELQLAARHDVADVQREKHRRGAGRAAASARAAPPLPAARTTPPPTTSTR